MSLFPVFSLLQGARKPNYIFLKDLIFYQAVFKRKRWNIYPQSKYKVNSPLPKGWHHPHTSRRASAALWTMKWVYFSGQSKNEVFCSWWTQWSLFLGGTLLMVEEKIVLKYYNHGTHILKNNKSILIFQAKGAGVKPSPQSHSEIVLIKFSP